MKEIINQLRKEKFGWKINKVKSYKKNIYYTKNNKIESVLGAEREDIIITIYIKYGKEIGESSFPLSDISDLKKQIEEAKIACKYAKKPLFKLPKKGEISKVKIADPEMISLYKKKELGNYLVKTANKIIKEFKKYPVVLNGMEIFSEIRDAEIVNSEGLNVKQRQTEIYIESVITAKKGKNEQEFFPYVKHIRLKDFIPSKWVKYYTMLAHDVLNSKKASHYEGEVILSGDAVGEFFYPHLSLNPLVAHSSGRLHYLKMSRYKKGKNIAEIKGDEINILSEPVDFNVASTKFDGDGIGSKKLQIIKKNKFNEYLSSKRYADYLGIKETGTLNCVVIPPGKHNLKNLSNIYEIVSFSSFCPNSLSGDFSAEIRLGYIHKNGKKYPFKGGMFTGNVFELIKNIKFSKETVVLEGYVGPKKIMFIDAVIG